MKRKICIHVASAGSAWRHHISCLAETVVAFWERGEAAEVCHEITRPTLFICRYWSCGAVRLFLWCADGVQVKVSEAGAASIQSLLCWCSVSVWLLSTKQMKAERETPSERSCGQCERNSNSYCFHVRTQVPDTTTLMFSFASVANAITTWT